VDPPATSFDMARPGVAPPLVFCHKTDELFYNLCCTHKGDEATSIPAQCCAMPYILNGEVYYNCSVNAAESNDLGCYRGDGQSQWVNCHEPQGTLVKF